MIRAAPTDMTGKLLPGDNRKMLWPGLKAADYHSYGVRPLRSTTMTALHFLNGILWLINAVMWLAYAHSLMGCVLNALAGLACFFMYRNELDQYP
jgi:hypothetical protein